MSDSSLPGDILPLPRGASTETSTSAAPNAGRALAVVSRLARSHPLSDEFARLAGRHARRGRVRRRGVRHRRDRARNAGRLRTRLGCLRRLVTLAIFEKLVACYAVSSSENELNYVHSLGASYILRINYSLKGSCQ